MKKIFFAGESYIGYTVHVKGADSMTTQSYTENATRFIKSLKDSGYDVTYMPSHVALSDFPDTVEKLNEYDLVILSDIGANTLLMTKSSMPGGIPAPNRCKAIREYVRQGGSFLMIGGFMSFTGIEGKAHYGTTAIADVIPADLQIVDDRVETPEGSVPVINEPNHPIFAGIPADVEWPYMIGYNKLIPNPEKGQVLASFEEGPYIVAGEFGEGRSVAYTSDCAPHWGSPKFIAWEYYDKLWSNIVEWLTEKRGQ